MVTLKAIIKILILLQCLGAASLAYLDGTSVGTYLFLYGGLEETYSYAVNYGIALVLALIAFSSIYRIRAVSLFVVSVVFATEAFFKTVLGGSFASDLTMAAHIVRFGWPLVIGLSLVLDPTWQSIKRRDVNFFLRLFLSVTFIVHGAEALMMHPKFIDFVIVFTSKVEIFPSTEAFARASLYLIGVLDLIVGVLLVVKPSRKVIFYMGAWGLITALSRYVYADVQGIPDVLIRAPHFCIPILLWFLVKPITVKTPVMMLQIPSNSITNTYC